MAISAPLKGELSNVQHLTEGFLSLRLLLRKIYLPRQREEREEKYNGRDF